MSFENTVKRVDDRTFCLVRNNKPHINFEVKSKKLSIESCDQVAKVAIEKYIKDTKDETQFKERRFTCGGRTYKITEKKDSKFYYRLFRCLGVYTIHSPPTQNSRGYVIKKTWKNPFKKPNNVPITIPLVSPAEYQQGIRAQVPLESRKKDPGLFQDPFTQLATSAFERYEPAFKAKDGFQPLDCDCRIVEVEGKLMLVKKDSPLATPENLNFAVVDYRIQVKKMVGEEKFAYINHLYGLDLQNIRVLTPEHVFRMNMGMLSFELQDLTAAFKALCALKPGDARQNFITMAEGKIPDAVMLCMNRHLKQAYGVENPTMQDFKKWMKLHCKEYQALDKCSPQVFNELISIFYPSAKELESAFTGRKIFKEIEGAYTQGAYETFKPWIDQQELIQVFPRLIKASSHESYYELLAHIIGKKHLAHAHPTEKIRVGTLIPAPSKEAGGEIRWYVVRRCFTNKYTYIYELTSACKDPSLPDIQIHRNTASSTYAIYSTEGILNDLNLLNPPGYMGSHLLDLLQKDFFHPRTIPLWVGCQLLAAQKLSEKTPNVTAIYKLLKHANAAYKRESRRPFNPLTFRDLLKKHDVILNKLYYRNEAIFDYKNKESSKEFLKLFKRLMKVYIQVDFEQYELVSMKTKEEDAVKLIAIMKQLEQSNPDTEEKLFIKLLLKDLNQYLTQKETTLTPNLKMKDLEKYEELAALRLQNPEEAMAILQKWSLGLGERAIAAKEDVPGKMKKSIVLTGQSLGGASAQAALARYMTNQERMPVPNQMCYLIDFEAPGVSTSDNQQFKKFLTKNARVLKGLNIQFKIYRRCEVGDVVFGVGEEHLGAAFSKEEANKLKKCLSFDAALNYRLKHAKRREIAEARAVHETLFEEGQKIPMKMNLKKRRLKISEKPKTKEGDYLEIQFDAQILGVFNSHGKKGELRGKDGKKAYAKMHDHIWKMPPLLDERLRKSTEFKACQIRRLVFKGRTDGRKFPEAYQDPYGCVVVSL